MLEAPRRFAVGILAGFVVVLVALMVSLYLTSQHDDSASHSTSDDQSLGHVHGLGVDPADGRLYIASHTGVFRVVDGRPQRVADRWQDTMGFAVIGSGNFLASGHPDLREDLPTMLGLIESVDAAESWQAVSLQGEADLHAIEPTDSTVYAYDFARGQLIASDDRRTWRVLAARPLVDLAARAAETGDELYATTPAGKLLRYDVHTGGATVVAGAPALVLIDTEDGHRLVGVAPGGQVFTSADGSVWREVGTVNGPPEALDAAPGQWHVATEAGVYQSTNEGRRWEAVVRVLASGH